MSHLSARQPRGGRLAYCFSTAWLPVQHSPITVETAQRVTGSFLECGGRWRRVGLHQLSRDARRLAHRRRNECRFAAAGCADRPHKPVGGCESQSARRLSESAFVPAAVDRFVTSCLTFGPGAVTLGDNSQFGSGIAGMAVTRDTTWPPAGAVQRRIRLFMILRMPCLEEVLRHLL